MTPQDISNQAVKLFNNIVQQINDDQWNMEMPADFQTSSEGASTLKTIIDYHAYDDAWIPDMLAGKTMDEVGQDKFKGDLLGSDRRAMFAEIAGIACDAIEGITDLDKTVHCSFGDFTTREYLQQVMFFRGLRTYDVAKAIGAKHGMTDDFATALYNELAPQAEDWRKIGVFGAEIMVPQDASILERLLGMTGRKL